MQNRIGFVSLGMGAFSLEDALKVGMASGAEVMELNGRPTVHRNLWLPPIDFAAIQARIATSGIVPTSLGGYSSFAQVTDEGLQTQIEQLVGYCDVARQMRIPVVRAFAGDVVEGHNLDELYPRLVAGFKAVTSRIAGWGVRIGIENHSRLINDGDLLWGLIHDVGSPDLGMTLDTGNFCWAGHSIATAERFFEKLAPLTVNVHIKDGRFIENEWVLYPAGRGDLDLAGLFAALAQAGYAGPILSEYEGRADFTASTLESVAYLRGLRDGMVCRQ
jgi:sugar phosphate isomerase/epimerase